MKKSIYISITIILFSIVCTGIYSFVYIPINTVKQYINLASNITYLDLESTHKKCLPFLEDNYKKEIVKTNEKSSEIMEESKISIKLLTGISINHFSYKNGKAIVGAEYDVMINMKLNNVTNQVNNYEQDCDLDSHDTNTICKQSVLFTLERKGFNHYKINKIEQ